MAEAVDLFDGQSNGCPKFEGYEKMKDNSNDFADGLNAIKKWVVLEKIHGSNFSLTVWCNSERKDDICVKLGRRTAYLGDEEKFYKVETQFEFQARLKENAIRAWKNVNQIDSNCHQIVAITIFGELFGGRKCN